MPGPWSVMRRTRRLPCAFARTATGSPPECRTPFSSRFDRARSSCAGSASTSGRSGSSCTSKRAPRSDGLSSAASSTSSTALGSECVSMLPDSSRERSSRLATRLVSRSASPLITSLISRRSAGDSVVESIPPAAAAIAVSGERRSCDTARRSAVLRPSLRLSALFSTSFLLELGAARTCIHQDAERRRESPLELLHSRLAGLTREEHGAHALTSGEQRQRSLAGPRVHPAGVEPDALEAERPLDACGCVGERVALHHPGGSARARAPGRPRAGAAPPLPRGCGQRVRTRSPRSPRRSTPRARRGSPNARS